MRERVVRNGLSIGEFARACICLKESSPSMNLKKKITAKTREKILKCFSCNFMFLNFKYTMPPKRARTKIAKVKFWASNIFNFSDYNFLNSILLFYQVIVILNYFLFFIYFFVFNFVIACFNNKNPKNQHRNFSSKI